ncbi:hypothetical protein PRZ61_04880 [Halomonas pacifica]|uniref:hypothetical protein n=1 Tax=Bisbaumannia pacifica TaxID=77098 RepID=UPI00235A470A|nr:hypothetical protein [Halomonas pacifica]MDC8802780.1 hypothetical protein [Halomonas pacifica]
MHHQPENSMDLLPADALKKRSLGLSVSDSPDLERLGLLDNHFRMTLGELARTVIIAGGSLYYGGHLHPEGITTFLIEELHRYGRRDRPLKVCLAWTVHQAMTPEQIKEQKDYLGLFGEIHFLSFDGERISMPTEPTHPNQFTAEEKSRALSGLRSYMTKNTDARILIGGKRKEFEGNMPGIVEEAIFSIEQRQPLYLAGGFGGATLDIVRTLRPDHAEWFPIVNDPDDIDEREKLGLERLQKAVSDTSWNGYENGLNEEENQLLSASYRPSEVAALVGLGLGRLLTANNL